MFLHLGQNVLIRQDDIIGIFDLDNTTVSKRTRDYLTKAEKKRTGDKCQHGASENLCGLRQRKR